MTTEQRYVVKLPGGKYMTNGCGVAMIGLERAAKFSRAAAYRLAADWANSGTVVVRLRPSARAAELAKLRAEVERLQYEVECTKTTAAVLRADTVDAENRLDAMTAERDALAAQLAALPPDVTDEELAKALKREWCKCSSGSPMHDVAREARRLLRGPVAPVRPVEELRDELRALWGRQHNADWSDHWLIIAKRARELGAR